jgi:uncharacterized membrane protein
MNEKSTFWVDLAITLFAATVALVYFGGYYFPVQIGSWTGVGMLVYLLMLIFTVLSALYAIVNKNKGKDEGTKRTEKGAKRS